MTACQRAATERLRALVGAGLAGALITVAAARADPVKVVAAENVYGDIVRQIGGVNVNVISILTMPTQDPHEFEAGASAARAIAESSLVIYNGADYDPWAARLLSATRTHAPEMIEVARLVHSKPGDNPHLWYEPAAVTALGEVVAASLTHLDPQHGADYARGHAEFEAAMERLRAKIAVLRTRYAGTVVTATEPVFGYMADALGLDMRHGRFQLAVMNGTEPSAAAIVALEHDLRTHVVRVLLYNAQTSQALAERMRAVAAQAGVPVVAVTETLPPGLNYQEWMGGQLDALGHALGES